MHMIQMPGGIYYAISKLTLTDFCPPCRCNPAALRTFIGILKGDSGGIRRLMKLKLDLFLNSFHHPAPRFFYCISFLPGTRFLVSILEPYFRLLIAVIIGVTCSFEKKLRKILFGVICFYSFLFSFKNPSTKNVFLLLGGYLFIYFSIFFPSSS